MSKIETLKVSQVLELFDNNVEVDIYNGDDHIIFSGTISKFFAQNTIDYIQTNGYIDEIQISAFKLNIFLS